MFKPSLVQVDYTFELNFPIQNVEYLIHTITERVWLEKHEHTELYERLMDDIISPKLNKHGLIIAKWNAYGTISVTITLLSEDQLELVGEILSKSTRQFWNILKKYKETKLLTKQKSPV